MARAIYSSHPIVNYTIGGFTFANTLLDFNSGDYSEEEEAKFVKLHESLPPAEKNRIKKLDIGVAEEVSRRALSSTHIVTGTLDSGDGRPPAEKGTSSLEESQSRPGQRLDNQGDPLDPVIKDNAPTGGTGDANSGENHGEGNVTGTGEAPTPKELATKVAEQGSRSRLGGLNLADKTK